MSIDSWAVGILACLLMCLGCWKVGEMIGEIYLSFRDAEPEEPKSVEK